MIVIIVIFILLFLFFVFSRIIANYYKYLDQRQEKGENHGKKANK